MSQADAAPPPPDDGRVEVTIDGRVTRAPKGQLVLDAATDVGIHIPIYCAHPKMDPVAVCRMCLVQVEKLPKLQPACATVVTEGMVVDTQSDATAKAREGMLEFLLLNHPLDCPVCDRGGECDLQDFTFRYGPSVSRFPITDKVHFNKAVPLSEHIELDQERCILCWRCVRYYDEITGEHEIVLEQRGVQTLVTTFDEQPLRSVFQGNLPEVVPVGARTHPGEARDTVAAEAISAAATLLRDAIDKHGGPAVGVFGSAQSTNEELWLLQRLARYVLGTPHLDHQLEAFPDLDASEHELGI